MNTQGQSPLPPPINPLLNAIIRIFVWILSLPLFIIMWTLSILVVLYYIIFVSRADKREHKKRIMEAYNLPWISNWNLIWYKSLSFVERFQVLEVKKLLLLHFILWNIIILLIRIL